MSRASLVLGKNLVVHFIVMLTFAMFHFAQELLDALSMTNISIYLILSGRRYFQDRKVYVNNIFLTQ